ncbi:MAG: hypothetical protein WBH28_24020 [Fuerstiella sp.]
MSSVALAVDDPADWQVQLSDTSAVKLVNRTQRTEGDLKFARFHLQSGTGFQQVKLILPRPRSLAHDDFSTSVKLSSNVTAIQFGLRLVLPMQLDPRTGMPVVTSLIGGTSSKLEQWQTLSAVGNSDAVKDRIRKLRAEMVQSAIDLTGAYFDACVVVAEIHKGDAFIDVAVGDYGPVVSPDDTAERVPVGTDVQHVRRVHVQRGQVVVDGQRIFPRFMPDHGESEQFLKRLGVNGVWVGDLHGTPRMQALIDQQVLVIATPPHPEFDPADFSAPLQGLPPLESVHPLPSIWYLGTGVTADQMPHLMAWGREVRSADRLMQRPLMADVLALEGVASRQLDLVGISQHSVGGLRSFGEARNRSYARQNSAAQLTLPWEWIQTEQSPALNNWRGRLGLNSATIEPEQIMMQLVAMLSSGSRGIGFWKTHALDGSSAESQEVSKTVELALLYLDIVEPLLEQGRVEGHIDVNVAADARQQASSRGILQNFGSANSNGDRYATAPAGPDAALINSPGMSLILAAFWDNVSQFVPQELFAGKGTMTVAASETASAWRVTATGIQGLRRQPTAGGLLIDIEDFDQFAIILVSSDPQDRRGIEKRILRNIERAAHLFVDIAALKLDRVSKTCAGIDSVISSSDSTSSQLFVKARTLTDAARQALGRRDYSGAESYSRACLRELRKIQNRYWYRAVQSLPTPMASPYSISFSSLSDHWQMMSRIQGDTATDSLLPSGNFDDVRLLSDGTWTPVSSQEDFYHTGADIVSENRRDNHVLRIRAWRKAEGLPNLDKPSVLIRSPELNVVKGAVYEVSGRVKVGQAIVPELDTPFSIFDSDLGPEFAVRPTLEPSWRTFRIYRQASETGPWKVWMSVNGAAEVFVDDFSVRQVAGVETAPQIPELTEPEVKTLLNLRNSSRVKGAGYAVP